MKKQDLSGGTIFGEVPDWDIANNPTIMASEAIKRQRVLAEARLVFTEPQIQFLIKYKIL